MTVSGIITSGSMYEIRGSSVMVNRSPMGNASELKRGDREPGRNAGRGAVNTSRGDRVNSIGQAQT